VSKFSDWIGITKHRSIIQLNQVDQKIKTDKSMQNVILISTEHRESGKCNSDELYKIIESINPDIIFEEETNDDTFQKYYNEENSFNSLEVQCVKKYLQNHDIKHIPIDIGLSQYTNFREWDYMFDTFKKYNVYNQTEREHCTLRDKDGFAYLNSKKCVELFELMKNTERQIIEWSGINKNALFRIYNIFHKEHDNRENGMLQNIYNYSEENQYNRAVFLLGFAHRKSIIQKIKKHQTTEIPKLNWTFYNDGLLTHIAT
jgi:DNA-binding protein Fis